MNEIITEISKEQVQQSSSLVIQENKISFESGLLPNEIAIRERLGLKNDSPKVTKDIKFDKPVERNIDVKEFIRQRENGPVVEPTIQKDGRGLFIIINVSDNSEIEVKFEEDERRRKMSVKMKDPVKKKTEEEKICHGEAIGTRLDLIDDNILDGDYSLKAKIQKERTEKPKQIYNEKKPFKEKKNAIEEFFKTNVENMIEDRKIRFDRERKEELNQVTK
jgi:hypothetical protein